MLDIYFFRCQHFRLTVKASSFSYVCYIYTSSTSNIHMVAMGAKSRGVVAPLLVKSLTNELGWKVPWYFIVYSNTECREIDMFQEDSSSVRLGPSHPTVVGFQLAIVSPGISTSKHSRLCQVISHYLSKTTGCTPLSSHPYMTLATK